MTPQPGSRCGCGHLYHQHYDTVMEDRLPGGKCRGRRCGCRRFSPAGDRTAPQRYVPPEVGSAVVVGRVGLPGQRYRGRVVGYANGVARVAFAAGVDKMTRSFLVETGRTTYPADWELLPDDDDDEYNGH